MRAVDLASQPVRNRAPDPRSTKWATTAPVGPGASNERWNNVTTYTLVTGATDGPPGLGITSYARATFTTGTQGGLGFHLADNPEAGAPTPARMIPVTPGQRISLGIWVRSAVTTAAFTLKYRWATGSTWVSGAVSPTSSVTAGVWQLLPLTAIVPAGATHLSVAAQHGVAVAVGTTLDVTGLMIIDDLLPPTHVDGETPGWRWTGTVGASESVGYPYTLEGVAGAPPIVLPGGAGMTSTDLPGATATSGRTLYAVHSVDSLVNTPSVARIGDPGGSSRRLRFSYAPGDGGDGSMVMFEPGGSAISATATIPGARSLGRHVVAMVLEDGAATATVNLDGGLDYSLAVPADKQSFVDLTVSAHHSVDSRTVHAVAYPKAHPLATRRQVTAWLARRYGGPVPAGY